MEDQSHGSADVCWVRCLLPFGVTYEAEGGRKQRLEDSFGSRGREKGRRGERGYKQSASRGQIQKGLSNLRT